MHMLLISPKIMVLLQHLILKIYLHIRHQYPFLMTHLLIPLLALPLNIHRTLFHCTLHTHKESIDVILDKQVVLTRDGVVRHFLVPWHGRLEFDCTWITRDDLQQLDPALSEHFQSGQDALDTQRHHPPITRVYGRRRQCSSYLVALQLYNDGSLPYRHFGHHLGFLNSTDLSLSHPGRVDADTKAWTFSTYC